MAPHILQPREITLLRHLAEQPRQYGYELRKSLPGFSLSQIYYSLEKLRRLGLAEVSLRKNAKAPARKCYVLTKRGHQWLAHRTYEEISYLEDRCADLLSKYRQAVNRLQGFYQLRTQDVAH